MSKMLSSFRASFSTQFIHQHLFLNIFSIKSIPSIRIKLLVSLFKLKYINNAEHVHHVFFVLFNSIRLNNYLVMPTILAISSYERPAFARNTGNSSLITFNKFAFFSNFFTLSRYHLIFLSIC